MKHLSKRKHKKIAAGFRAFRKLRNDLSAIYGVKVTDEFSKEFADAAMARNEHIRSFITVHKNMFVQESNEAYHKA